MCHPPEPCGTQFFNCIRIFTNNNFYPVGASVVLFKSNIHSSAAQSDISGLRLDLLSKFIVNVHFLVSEKISASEIEDICCIVLQ